MATADAREASEKYGVRVVFGDGKTRHWSEVFDRNPLIAKELKPNEQFAWVANYPGRRPYVKQVHKDRFEFWPEFKAKVGDLYPSDPRPKGDYVLIEPNVKQAYWIGKNKDWGFQNWKALVSKLDCEWYQMGGEPYLDKKRIIKTRAFTNAINHLAGARLLITTDGALHHAAAALGVPAIVLWGGLASPENLGYDTQTNIWHGDEPCGTHSSKCMHCIEAMKKITVEEVLEAYERS